MMNDLSVEMSTPDTTSPALEEFPADLKPSTNEDHTPYICLPYRGLSGEEIIRKFRNTLNNSLPNNVKPRIAFQGKKIGSFFRIKDKVPLEHESDLVYAFKPKYNADPVTEYVGETRVRYGTRTYEHCYTDKESSIFKYKEENNFQVSEDDFEILDKGFNKSVNRKLAEALYIKDLDPVLNRQKKSIALHLFNLRQQFPVKVKDFYKFYLRLHQSFLARKWQLWNV